MNIHANVHFLNNQISALLLEYPDLADDEDFRTDVFEGETNLNHVLSVLVGAALEASTMANAIKARATELNGRKSRFDRKDEAMRKLILSVMERAELSKVLLTEATLSMRHLPPSPMVIDEAALPDNCVRIERKPDMKAIKAEIEGGRDVQGVAMSNARPSLTIRTK